MGHIVDTLTTGTGGTHKTPEFPYTEQVNQPPLTWTSTPLTPISGARFKMLPARSLTLMK